MASGRIQGITIEIDGNTTKLSQSLKSVDGQISETQKALKDINKLLKLDPGNVELLTQKQKNLTGAIDNTTKRLDELKAEQKNVAEGTDDWDRLQREIIATEQDLESLKDQYSDFGSVAAQQVAAAGQKMEDFGNKVTKAGEAFMPISKAATAALGALGGMAYKAVSSADELATLAQQTGFTTDEIQKMQYAADLVDVSFEDIEGALKKLKPKITENNKALADLGVSTKNADGSTRDATAVFYDAIEALSKIPNETERDQKAMELFGKSADSLAGIIDDGGAALKAYGQEAEDLGIIMGEDTVESLNKVNDTLSKLKGQAGGALGKLGATVAEVLAPSLEKILGIVGKVTDAIAKLTPEQAETILKILAITAAIGPLLKTGGKLISGIGSALKLAPKIVAAIKLIGAALSPQTLLIAAIVAAVVALGIIIYKNWDDIVAWTKNMVEKVKGFFQNMKQSIIDAVNNIKDRIVNTWTNIKSTVTNAAQSVKNAVTGAWDNIKTNTTQAFDSVKNTVSTKMQAVQKSFNDAGGGLKGVASATMTAIKEYYTLGFDTINNLTGGKLESIKNAFSNAFNSVKSTVSNAWTNIKGTFTSQIGNIQASVSSGFNNIVNRIREIFRFDFSLPALKVPTWSDLAGHFSGLIQSLKNAFKFDWSLPKIKLPHFKVTAGEAPYGLGGKGKLPSISIEWYKKAYQNPVMFTSPTVLQTAQGYKGFGDGSGAEIVMGLNKLRELVGAGGNVTVNVYGSSGQNVDELADAVTRKIINLQKQRNYAYA